MKRDNGFIKNFNINILIMCQYKWFWWWSFSKLHHNQYRKYYSSNHNIKSTSKLTTVFPFLWTFIGLCCVIYGLERIYPEEAGHTYWNTMVLYLQKDHMKNWEIFFTLMLSHVQTLHYLVIAGLKNNWADDLSLYRWYTPCYCGLPLNGIGMITINHNASTITIIIHAVCKNK